MSEFTRGNLKLAFAWHVSREIMDADLEVAEGETAWLDKTFSKDRLTEAGFVDAEGSATVDYEQALGEALITLPDALPLSEKLALITTLFHATLADDDFHHEEGNVLVKAARLLGVTSDELDQHLGSLDEVGEVDLPEPDDD